MAARGLVLIRHGCVHSRYRGLCYGQSDIELSDQGHDQSAHAAETIRALPVTHLYCSSLDRARVLATHLTRTTGLTATVDARLNERHFGTWELLPWDEIYDRTGSAMDGLIDEPDRFAPPGGETSYQMRDRVMSWYRDLPARGIIAMAGHGGPIAALLGTLRGLAPREWLRLIPAYGAWTVYWE